MAALSSPVSQKTPRIAHPPSWPSRTPTYSICRVLAICTVRCLGKPGCNPSPAIGGGVISADPLRPPNPSPALRDTRPKDQRQRQRPSTSCGVSRWLYGFRPRSTRTGYRKGHEAWEISENLENLEKRSSIRIISVAPRAK
jgi:hypothetical protein